MSKIKTYLSKLKLRYYHFRYVIAGWHSDRMHRKRMRAICKLDDRRRAYDKLRDELGS